MSVLNIAKLTACAVFVYVLLLIVTASGWNPLGLQLDFERVGQFGDSFAPLSALMAAIAAVGAVGAYLSQREELAEAKRNGEIERRSSNRRDFEVTFFNLIKMFRDTAKEIEASDAYGHNPVSGRDAVARLVQKLRSGIVKHGDDIPSAYSALYGQHRDDLGHYFRILYQTVRFLDESEIDDKITYARIIRASLSNSEIVILALNCMYGEGDRKFKPLVEKFALLHNISESDFEAWGLYYHFSASAFGDRPEMLARANKDAPG